MADVFEQLSPNFNRREFACKGSQCCGGVAPIDPRLIDALQELRTLVGSPIHVTSGFRCFTHNQSVGSAPSSQHCKGLAADIRVDSLDTDDLAEFAESIEAFRRGGIGQAETFVHVDVRGRIARWTY